MPPLPFPPSPASAPVQREQPTDTIARPAYPRTRLIGPADVGLAGLGAARRSQPRANAPWKLRDRAADNAGSPARRGQIKTIPARKIVPPFRCCCARSVARPLPPFSLSMYRVLASGKPCIRYNCPPLPATQHKIEFSH